MVKIQEMGVFTTGYSTLLKENMPIAKTAMEDYSK
jgi:hypothetical protein